MRLTIAFLGLIVIACADAGYPLPNRCGAPGVAVYNRAGLDHLFGEEEGEISAGEINGFVDWGNKRIWLVSNGNLNTSNGQVRLENCLVIQEQSLVEVKYTQGADGRFNSFLADPDPDHFYTINQGQFYGDVLELVVSRWRRTGSGWAERQHERSFIYVISPVDWRVSGVTEIRAASELMFGSSAFSDSGYTYVYATRNVFWDKDVLVARVQGSWLNAWEFYDGYLWQRTAEHIRPVFSGTSDYFSVFKQGSDYYAVGHGALFAQEILLFRAHAPHEGWHTAKVLYCAAADGETLTVNAIVLAYHEQTITCGYGIIPASLVYGNHAPAFIDINGWNY